jgi:heptose I phosphotransferase
MSHGTLWRRLARGIRWTWISDSHRTALPKDLEATVMALESRDRLHAKQGRSTARFIFHSPEGPLPVYLKRHYELPWRARLGALFHPKGRHSPASAEWAHLERVRSMGIAVPDVVAAGERIGPWGSLQSFLMVAELTDCLPLNEALPELAKTVGPVSFAARKRALIAEMASIIAKLHSSYIFHKDLYLCHFYLDMRRPRGDGRPLTLIDLHRLAEHRYWPDRWRWKDLGQLLFSTFDVAGVTDRDRLRFWALYRKRVKVARPEWQLKMITLKADRYREHNR